MALVLLFFIFPFTFGQVNYVAACTVNGTFVSTILVSGDGISWTPATQQVHDRSLNGAAFSPLSGRWVITGVNTPALLSTYFSDDGNNWSVVQPANLFSSAGQGVTFVDRNGGLWVVCGGNGGSLIWFSTNGANFTAASTQPPGMANVRAVAYSSTRNQWVGVGETSSAGVGFSVTMSADANVWNSVGSSTMFGGPLSVGFEVAYSCVPC
jgi:hypothetical protein